MSDTYSDIQAAIDAGRASANIGMRTSKVHGERCPRKVYLVISRIAKDVSPTSTLCTFYSSKARADEVARDCNARAYRGATDWRVETFVKGD